jgi:hypothetical protein
LAFAYHLVSERCRESSSTSPNANSEAIVTAGFSIDDAIEAVINPSINPNVKAGINAEHKTSEVLIVGRR